MLLLLSLAACHPNDDGPAAPEDTDVPTDTDLPADTDTGGDTHTGGDTDTPTDTDTARDTDSGGETLPLGATCEPGVSDCGADAGCCTSCCEAGAVPVCTELDDAGACPLPDVTVDATALAESLFVHDEEFAADDCAVVEECVSGTGWRRLLRFQTTTPNIGTADLVLGSPSEDAERFELSECHGHYHYSGYAEYALLDTTGAIAVSGRKQAFCLMDTEPVGEGGGWPRFHCGLQGLSAGWQDTYVAWLDCQWLDVTDVPPGEYTLRLTIDPDGTLRESDTANNVVSVPVTLVDPDAVDVTAPCDSAAFGEDRDCGWEDAGTFACTPGETLTLGCDGACDGVCLDDPVLRLCDGAAPDCTSMDAIGSNDDAACGTACSALEITCPASGTVQALTGAWDASATAECAVTTL